MENQNKGKGISVGGKFTTKLGMNGTTKGDVYTAEQVIQHYPLYNEDYRNSLPEETQGALILVALGIASPEHVIPAEYKRECVVYINDDGVEAFLALEDVEAVGGAN